MKQEAKIDIHNRAKTMRLLLERIEKNPAILPENRKAILSFKQHLELENRSISRVNKLLDQLSRISIWLGKPFREATKQDIEELVVRVKNRKVGNDALSPLTVVDYQITLKQFYKWLEGDNETFPKKVSWLKGSLKKIRILEEKDVYTPEEIQQIIDKGCTTERDRAIVALGYETLSRIGELGNIRVGSLAIQNGEGTLVLDGKSGRREAFIQFAVPYVNRWLELHPHRNKSDFEHSPLFVLHQPAKGFPAMTYAAFRKVLNEAVNRSGLTKRFSNPHIVFRKSRATHIAQLGGSERDLMSLGGWKDSDSVSHYIARRNLRDIVNRLNGKTAVQHINALEPIKCLICGQENPPKTNECTKCFNPLNVVAAVRIKRQQEAEIATMREEMKMMNEALQTISRKLNQT